MRHGIDKFPSIISHFYGTPWAIMPEKLAELHRVLWARVNAGAPEFVQAEQIAKANNVPPELGQVKSGGRISPLFSSPGAVLVQMPGETDESEPKYQLVGSVAIIKISGVISSRASIFDDWSGGTSHESIGRATDQALADGKVESIVYDIDSPGGTVYGQPEAASKVFAARKQKPTTAVANHLAASAAYWHMSQASTAVVTPAGQVGCIGVISRAMDYTEMQKAMGVKDILVSNSTSPYKTEGYPQVPFTDAQRADMQAMCDKYAAVFVEAVAKGRGIRPATVEKSFGQGRCLLSEDALAARMVDRIGTLEEVVNGANGSRTAATRRKVAAQLAQLGLPTAKR